MWLLWTVRLLLLGYEFETLEAGLALVAGFRMKFFLHINLCILKLYVGTETREGSTDVKS